MTITHLKIHVESIIGPPYPLFLASISASVNSTNRVVLWYLLLKNSAYKWTSVVQTHVVQGSTVLTQPLLSLPAVPLPQALPDLAGWTWLPR